MFLRSEVPGLPLRANKQTKKSFFGQKKVFPHDFSFFFMEAMVNGRALTSAITRLSP